jgi:hypothetical protein
MAVIDKAQRDGSAKGFRGLLLSLLVLGIARAGDAQITSYPYEESFEAGLGDWVSVPSEQDQEFRWKRVHDTPRPATDAPASAHQGEYYLYAHTMASDRETTLLVGPAFHLTGLADPRLSFWYRIVDSGGLEVELSSDGGLTWQAVWSVFRDQGDLWHHTVISLAANPSPVLQIRFKGVAGGLDGLDTCGLALDNITVSGGLPVLSGYVRTWAGMPLPGVTISATNDAGSTTTDGGGYYFLPVASGWSGMVTYRAEPMELDPPGRMYNGVVRSLAGEDCRTRTVTFYPYAESFETGLGQWYNHPKSYHTWQRDSSQAPNSSLSSAAEGTFYMRTVDRSTSLVDVVLEGPAFDLSRIVNPQLCFWHYMHSGHVGSLYAEASDDQGQSWQVLWTLSGIQADRWREEVVSLSPYLGKTLCVRFRYSEADTRSIPLGGDGDRIAIDNICLYDGPPIISGYALTAAGQGIADVLLRANGATQEGMTEATGYYYVRVPGGWSGQVTPVEPRFTFDPSARNYTGVTADVLNQNYSGTRTRAVYVDAHASGANDGSSWTSAYRYLQDALTNAKYYDEIRVAQGTYRPDQGGGQKPGDRNASFELKSGVIVQGGYAGVTAQDPDVRDVDTFPTILSGDVLGNDAVLDNPAQLPGDPSRKDNCIAVVYAYQVDEAAVLDGFTIVGGNNQYQAGGAYVAESDPTITDCTFIGNAGGGLTCLGYSHPIITGCEFIGNALGGSGGGVKCEQNAQASLSGCTFTGNHAGVYGGGFYAAMCTPDVNDCTFQENHAEGGGAVYGHYSSISLRDCRFEGNVADSGGAILDDSYGVSLLLGCVFTGNTATRGGALCQEFSYLTITDSTFSGNSASREGDELLVVDGSLTVNGTSHISGRSIIHINPGYEMRVEDEAVINLGGGCTCNPDPGTGGYIYADGSLVLQGHAALQSTNVKVSLLDVNVPNAIQYNNITLQEATAGFGGEFFVAGNAIINCNNIVSEGDRYLDLDPDPRAPERPVITNNRVSVLIKKEGAGRQGTLLELRGRDYDAGGSLNPQARSGAFRASPQSPGFTDDPSQNWVLERLTLDARAKLNFTNRQGFTFQDPDAPYPETVYIRQLTLGPDAILNTALQALYYQDLILVDANAKEIARNPTDLTAVLANGARFEDIPLLGFSLGIIAMDDPSPSPHNEFDIRVRTRITDPNDNAKQPPAPALPDYAGQIQRVSLGPAPTGPAGGVMEMRTRAPKKKQASSVAAKGAFARAGEESITIEFEYLFLEDPNDEAGLIVYLSDQPEVGKHLVEVARIRPPAVGRPGSVESDLFGVFSATFRRGDLNFVRGTYVELELRGRDARCWIDNWDPKINCPLADCGNYNGVGGVDIKDYYLLLAELGLINPGAADKGCLDLCPDGCVTVHDLIAWDTDRLNLCPCATTIVAQTSLSTAWEPIPAVPADATAAGSAGSKPLLVSGVSIAQKRPLLGVDANGSTELLKFLPATGRLTVDRTGQACRIDPNGAIGRTADGTPVIARQSTKACGDDLVSIGFAKGRGVLLADAAFDPYEPDVVYVAPVQVTATGKNYSYVAAAKLRFYADANYTVEALYGDDPAVVSKIKYPDPNNTTHGNGEPDRQHLSEIEIDSFGNLFVVNSCWPFQNRVLIYDTSRSGAAPLDVSFDDPNNEDSPYLAGPTAMVLSPAGDELHLAFSGRKPQWQEHDLTKEIRCYRVIRAGDGTVTELVLDRATPVECEADSYLSSGVPQSLTLTSLTIDPAGVLYATGFLARRFANDDVNLRKGLSQFLTHPILAIVPPAAMRAEVRYLDPSALLAPLSVVYVGEKANATQ